MDLIIETVSNELSDLLRKYKGVPVSELLTQYNINLSSKGKLKTLTELLINQSDKTELKEFILRSDVQLKTVNVVRGGKVEASLSLPSFNFCDIVQETWETSSLRKMLSTTFFVLVFFEENAYGLKEKYLKTGFIWKMPEMILDTYVQQTWVQVVTNIKAGKIVKYIDEKGTHHTYFPRTSDGPYVHVRPHAASNAPPLQLPVPDKLTGSTKYKMHSFWLTRAYIEKILYHGDFTK